MTIERLQAHYGFTRTPFGRAMAPGMPHRHGTRSEALARIGWCISERALGVNTGEVGAGKTVAVRAAIGDLGPSRHTLIYLDTPPSAAAASTQGSSPPSAGRRFHKASLIPQTADLLAAEEHERGRLAVLVLDEAHLLDAGHGDRFSSAEGHEHILPARIKIFIAVMAGEPHAIPGATGMRLAVTPACHAH